jgi:hypothetical protein
MTTFDGMDFDIILRSSLPNIMLAGYTIDTFSVFSFSRRLLAVPVPAFECPAGDDDTDVIGAALVAMAAFGAADVRLT